MRGALKYLAAAAAVCLLPSAAFAQATITGTVRDSSNAVLPGVTVEATSPALLAPRVVVTDANGIYRIIDLPSGAYSIAYTLSGFSRTVRDNVAISGAGTFTIPVELRVGGLQETITVTTETPVVDVQSTRRETVLSAEVISTLPATRNYGAILAAVPGIEVSGVVGGSLTSAQTTPELTFFTARGGTPTEGRVMIDGMNVAAAFSGGGVSSLVYNTNDTSEIQVMIAGGLGENETGGPSMNLVPRSGGNRFAGQFFYNTAGDWSRSDNIDDELRSLGILQGAELRKSWDVNGSLGGPIKRDRLWFYGTVRNYGNARVIEGALGGNLYAGDPTRWDYAPDTSVAEVRNVQGRTIYSGRLTGQVGKSRITFSQENQYRCDGSTLRPDTGGCRQRGENWTGLGNLTLSPEAAGGYYEFPYYVSQATWTMPITNRLLLEGGFSRFAYINAAGGFGMVAPDAILDLIPVTEQRAIDGHRANFTYRGVNNYQDNYANPNNFRASAAYVTGAHNLKVGYQGAYQVSDGTIVSNSNLISYRFDNRIPNQFSIRLPDWQTANRTVQHSLFVQDQWTVRRLTLQGGLRYDHAYSWSPADGNGTTATSRFNAAPITFERTVSVRGYDDISPRVGVAYDLFGTGRTALKAHIGRYLAAATNDSTYIVNNPANRIATNFTRNWTDNDGDKVVDCDILNPALQNPASGSVDTCGALTGNALRFANAQTGLTQVNPDILGGWGVRAYDWQFSVGVQQEVLPRVSVEVGYARRWWGNFTVTDNRALGPADFESWTATAPVDPRLPGGGGYSLVEYEQRPETAGRAAQNYVTFETDFGPARTNYWNGVDVTGSARMANGLTFQGGTTTGRTVTDRCETVVHIDSPNPRNCRTVLPFKTTFRGSASYTVPKADVLVSSIVRLSPAPQVSASYNVPNTVVMAQLGHLPAGATINGNNGVNLLNPGQLYADRHFTQIDMRFAKILRFGGRRADIGVDLYNLFNVNTPTGYEDTYDPAPAVGGGQWLSPTGIVAPRFARVNLTVNF
jgi:hypothetical protein